MPQEIDRVNLSSLWGKHETLLNNVAQRIERLDISDLFDFFREPWTCAIYHDEYSSLQNIIDELLEIRCDKAGESIADQLIQYFKEFKWRTLPTEQMDEIEQKFKNSHYYFMLQEQVLKYLQENETFLPMYAYPLKISVLLQGLESSPLFQRQ